MMRIVISGAVPACVALSAAIMFFACTVKPAVTVTDADNGTKVEVKTGEVLAVKLEAQLGTGFGWKVISESTALVLKGDPEQISPGDQKPGGPEYQTFKFKAANKGESELKFEYAEGWKKDAKPLKEYTITVIVK
ncbi:MAG TPA: protease inhibitor I42 family protein [Spirochaetota bacterium]|nr:protease inhibitor I42 family protein [Spirochaetota bacterium]HOD15545.1 protease inhibitor I42 family protein [Spirochaetota bacterium]HPG49236.1 protease inhibitor I42 family protein [Spirochaetota bacterium]HPN12954.1 protease inhibitor I42 family protein [Spirochaetota bacterium]HQL83578.1 protease inhibitor I42 family protein [Spirochaetota bacterium]